MDQSMKIKMIQQDLRAPTAPLIGWGRSCAMVEGAADSRARNAVGIQSMITDVIGRGNRDRCRSKSEDSRKLHDSLKIC